MLVEFERKPGGALDSINQSFHLDLRVKSMFHSRFVFHHTGRGYDPQSLILCSRLSQVFHFSTNHDDLTISWNLGWTVRKTVRNRSRS